VFQQLLGDLGNRKKTIIACSDAVSYTIISMGFWFNDFSLPCESVNEPSMRFCVWES
jgi:hypothetical protein